MKKIANWSLFLILDIITSVNSIVSLSSDTFFDLNLIQDIKLSRERGGFTEP